MSGQKVLVLGKIHDAGVNRLREAGTFEIVERPDNPPDLFEQARDTDAIIVRTTPINPPLLIAARTLKLVARHGVGYDAVDVAALTGRGIPLALVGDVNSTAVAEHTLALMLSLAKRVPTYDKAIRSGHYAVRDSFAATELAGRTVLVLGFGRIGRLVAKLSAAFGMDVLVYDPVVPRADVEAQGYRSAADVAQALPAADYVTIHAPKIPGAKHLIGNAEIERMKAGAFLINVSRGGMVDEEALVRALEEKRLAGAGLDVFEEEPLPPDHPLARNEKVVLSPHSAAFTQECAERMALACAENVIAFAAGRLDPRLVVNPEVLSRMERT